MPAWDRCLDPPEAKIEADTPAVGPTKVGDLGEASDGQDVGRMSRRAILADLRCILDEEQLHDHQPENRHQTDQGQGSTVSEIALHEGAPGSNHVQRSRNPSTLKATIPMMPHGIVRKEFQRSSPITSPHEKTAPLWQVVPAPSASWRWMT